MLRNNHCVVTYYNQSYHYVVDLDLKSYFDNVNHDLLIKFLGNYISEPWALHLIRKFLTSDVMNCQLFEKSVKGTPQGGNISPCINIKMVYSTPNTSSLCDSAMVEV